MYWLWKFKGRSAIPPPLFLFPRIPREEQHQSPAWIISLRGFPLITALHCSPASSGVLALSCTENIPLHTYTSTQTTQCSTVPIWSRQVLSKVRRLIEARHNLLSAYCTSVLYLFSSHIRMYNTYRYVNVICTVSWETHARPSRRS